MIYFDLKISHYMSEKLKFNMNVALIERNMKMNHSTDVEWVEVQLL